MRRLLAATALLAGLLGQAASADDTSVDSKRPNVLLILADDLGYTDLGHYGSEINTPNLDALAREGISFSNFHTAATCAPARAMLMTGVNNHLLHAVPCQIPFLAYLNIPPTPHPRRKSATTACAAIAATGGCRTSGSRTQATGQQ